MAAPEFVIGVIRDWARASATCSWFWRSATRSRSDVDAAVRTLAVRTRLTLYCYLRSIGGPWLTVIYNLLNGRVVLILASA